MKSANPRSRIGAMKLRYYMTVTGMTIGIFLILNILLQILYMILETEPYVRLAGVIVLFILVCVLVHRIVNVRWIEKWTRVETEDTGVTAPEPEYVVDEELAKELEAQGSTRFSIPVLSKLLNRKKQEAETGTAPAVEEKKDTGIKEKPDDSKMEEPSVKEPSQDEHESEGSDWKTLFEDQETVQLSVRKEEENPPVSSVPKEPVLPRHAKSEDQTQPPVVSKGNSEHSKRKKKKEKAGENTETVSGRKKTEPVSRRSENMEPNEAPSSWAVPFDEMPTAALSSLPSSDAASKEPSSRTKEVDSAKREPARKKHRRLFHRREQTILEVTNHADGTASSRTVTEKAAKSSSRMKPEKGTDRKVRKEEKKKPAEPARKKENKQPVKKEAEKGSSWSVPFDEMPTEEMQKAVENALDGGYNPFSDDRNK